MLREISCSASATLKTFIALNQAEECLLLRVLFWSKQSVWECEKSGTAGERVESKIYSTVGTIQLLMIA
jgi:hypothetical protein